MAQFSEHDLTDAVIERLGTCDDPRFKTVMTALIRHLHGFVREVELTEAEWLRAIRFLTAVGQACDDRRQEFILLSDTLGVSILVDAINHRQPSGAVESTVLGPFYWEGAPELPLGADIANGAPGEPAFYSGRLLTLDGAADRRRHARCLVGRRRGRLRHADAGPGRDALPRQVPHRRMRAATGSARSARSTTRCRPTARSATCCARWAATRTAPGHIHMIVSAPGYQAVGTHLFVKGAPYLDSDAVFAVKDSLIVDFARHEPGRAPTGEPMDVPFYTCEYDFRLARA